ncbi:myb/SANT-like DNA-binding domain-containing protein 3 [Bacillus rossius redtenbacheri]|uniref:myb/SANT-like DNA-binding domain-containing protein 3 n=1 Tax=Bacillus rossius redtenbacheri TaxID=93214 RepID=UPI002FDED729
MDCAPRQFAERFSMNEKSILFSLVENRAKIVEAKKTDFKNVAEKRKAWQEIEKDFNSYSEVSKRTASQLKKCWENEKMKRKKILAANTRQRMATGGGPFVQEPSTNPELEVALAGTQHFIVDGGDHDMVVSADSAENAAKYQAVIALDHDYELPISESMSEEEITYEVEVDSPQVRKKDALLSGRSNKSNTRREVAIEDELQHRLHKLNSTEKREIEHHKLLMLEQKLRVRAARTAAIYTKELHEQAKNHCEEEHKLRMELMKSGNGKTL